ncbi:hypothetical protein [Glutamicibacter sp.]|uniref:hypothetical protein n=1 Tax=Glutamicibacter sp. TaxID=1931995 RepID=UPI0028BE145A|nr:hypothetical protein [Glutamicibacter sp.]
MDNAEALVHSIGLHAVSGIGKENLRALEVALDSDSHEAHIAVVLRHESEEQILRTTDKLNDLQILFLGEASIEWSFEEAGSRTRTVRATEKQYQYA